MNFSEAQYYLILSNGNLQATCYSGELAAENSVENHQGKIVFISYDNPLKDIQKIQKPNPLAFPERITINVDRVIKGINLETENYNPEISLVSCVSKTKYIEQVSRLKEHIQQGDIYEVNYCIPFEATNAVIDPFKLYKKLNAISSAPYSALARFNNQYIISASPELFLKREGNKLITKPIKGTAKRGTNAEEDAALKSALRESIKERTENVMIVDVSRNDLSAVSTRASVKVEKLFDIESYKQVHQMVSTVSCELSGEITFEEIIKSTFPMASMTGAPKIRAMELTADYEEFRRGPYSGCLGFMGPNGDFELSVLIRSIFYNAETNYLNFMVGSAITHMCDAEAEYEECLLKAQGLMKALNVSLFN